MLSISHKAPFAKAVVIAFLGLGAIAGQNAAFADGEKPDYMGRWVVDDPTEKFSANGRLYRIVDIAPCGADFCGVSVGEGQTCGATLFRFLTSHANDELLTGHGKWGDEKMKLQINGFANDKNVTSFTIGIGTDKYDITAREGSMPTFEANYHSTGEAICKVGTTS